MRGVTGGGSLVQRLGPLAPNRWLGAVTNGIDVFFRGGVCVWCSNADLYPDRLSDSGAADPTPCTLATAQTPETSASESACV